MIHALRVAEIHLLQVLFCLLVFFLGSDVLLRTVQVDALFQHLHRLSHQLSKWRFSPCSVVLMVPRDFFAQRVIDPAARRIDSK